MKPRLSFVLFLELLILLFMYQTLTAGCVPALIGLATGAAGGAVAGSKVKDKEPEKTQLQFREIQTRNYDTHDTKAVM
jgi:hypothetical protein